MCIKQNYFSLFDYLPWDEAQINSALIDGYEWETSPDTKSTWRIGDGTAPFYNYVYYTVAGFTEYDTFRSNQIREGTIDRESGLGSGAGGKPAALEIDPGLYADDQY